MLLLVLGRPLGQDGPHSNVRNVNLNHKLTGRIGMGAVVKRCLRSKIILSTAGDHVNSTVGEVSAERRAPGVLLPRMKRRER